MHSSFVPPIDDEEMEALLACAQELGLGRPNLTILDFEKSIASGHPVAAAGPPMGLAHLTNSFRAGKVVYSRAAVGEDFQAAVDDEINAFLLRDESITTKFLQHAIFADLCGFDLSIYAETSSVFETVLWITHQFVDLAYAREQERADKWREEFR